MLQVGDTVFTMATAGYFRVIAKDGMVVTIENEEGVRKTVFETNVRKFERPQPTADSKPS